LIASLLDRKPTWSLAIAYRPVASVLNAGV
jgi:hypothetical protein